jgi:hypothetical protein
MHLVHEQVLDKQHGLSDVVLELGLTVKLLDLFPELTRREGLLFCRAEPHAFAEVCRQVDEGVGHLPADVYDDILALYEDRLQQ